MKRIVRNTIALGGVALLGIGNAANAQYTYFPNDATVNYVVSSYTTVVGYASGDLINGFQQPSSPTVNFVTGSRVSDLFSYNSSIVNFDAGGATNLYPRNNSVINIKSGSFYTMQSLDSSVINFSGGSSTGPVMVDSQSAFNLSGGTIDSIDIPKSGVVTINGGSVSNGLNAQSNATVTINSGFLKNIVAIRGNSVLNFDGGSTDYELNLYDNSIANCRGGIFKSRLGVATVDNSSTFNIYGNGLSAHLTNPNFTGYSQYTLIGHLLDGTDATGERVYVRNGTSAKLVVYSAVPEPGSLALLFGMGTVGVGVLRKRRNR